MSQQALAQNDWQAVIDAHPLESHDRAQWLRYGVALLQTIEPGPEQGRQQQQAALAFLQAVQHGAAPQMVREAQVEVVRHNLRMAMHLLATR